VTEPRARKFGAMPSAIEPSRRQAAQFTTRQNVTRIVVNAFSRAAGSTGWHSTAGAEKMLPKEKTASFREALTDSLNQRPSVAQDDWCHCLRMTDVMRRSSPYVIRFWETESQHTILMTFASIVRDGWLLCDASLSRSLGHCKHEQIGCTQYVIHTVRNNGRCQTAFSRDVQDRVKREQDKRRNETHPCQVMEGMIRR
jgi:hypothetical protein